MNWGAQIQDKNTENIRSVLLIIQVPKQKLLLLQSSIKLGLYHLHRDTAAQNRMTIIFTTPPSLIAIHIQMGGAVRFDQTTIVILICFVCIHSTMGKPHRNDPMTRAYVLFALLDQCGCVQHISSMPKVTLYEHANGREFANSCAQYGSTFF